MNIINSNLVTADNDVLWDDITSVINDAVPRPVLILTSTHSNPTEGTQLLKMLEACKLRPEQYNIIQLNAGQQVAWYKLREQLGPKVIFLIGILPLQLGISSMLKLNVPNHFNDCIWLATLSIGELEQHPDVKKQLWTEGMKPVLADKSYVAF